MKVYTNIIRTTLTITLMVMLSLCGYAKERKKTKKKECKTTLGFQTGRDAFFNLNKAKQRTSAPASTVSFNFRKSISPKFKLETGIKYSLLQKQPGLSNEKYTQGMSAYKVALPISVQYYFLQEHNRFRPYCGIGLQYNLATFATNTNKYSRQETKMTTEQNDDATKRISILFTQGITFEVNTKIQVSQSFHFIPDNNIKIIGIDLGIGYKLQ